MAYIHSVDIKNFRGIEHFETVFKTGLQCIIGRGDTGKTTILEAISFLFSSSYTLQFTDSDFTNGNTNNEICIKAIILNLPNELLSKYGTFLICIDSENQIIEGMEEDRADSSIPALRIVLTVGKDLEPRWEVCARGYNQSVRASDRAMFGISFINEYVDRHFSFSKGGYLYRCAKRESEKNKSVNDVLDIIRDAKNSINSRVESEYRSTIGEVCNAAKSLGLEDMDIKPFVDAKDIMISDGALTLSTCNIPLKRLGKGSRKLLSIAIQLSNKDDSSVILIDELESGLEPDRIIQLIHGLKGHDNIQVIITTHSSTVLQELNFKELFLMIKNNNRLISFSEKDQALLRANPSSFFAKKIIVCEGKTEWGFIRSLEKFRLSQNLLNIASYGVVSIDGNGKEAVNRAMLLKQYGYEVLLFMDSDSDEDNKEKKNLIDKGVTIVDCEDGNSFENQLFNDAEWSIVKELLKQKIETTDGLSRNLHSEFFPGQSYNDNWYNNESNDLRIKLGNKAKKKSWYKNNDMPEHLGDVFFSHIQTIKELEAGGRFYSNVLNVINWIANEHS